MAVVNFNYPKFKYTIASTGQPGAGYKLFTYEEGTSTKKTTWTSLAKTAENTNPVILDANGEAGIWIDGNYKFVLAPPTDTDPPTSAVWTYDAVRSSDSSTSSTTTGASAPTNGSFETDVDADGEPDNWTVVAYSGGSVELDTTSTTHGATSLKFTSVGNGGGSAVTDEFYEVEAGKAIGVHFSIISANADTLNKVQVNWYNASQVFLSTSDAYNEGAANPTTWTRQYTTVTAPATAKYAKITITGVDPLSTTHSSTNFDNVELDTGLTGESIFTDIHQNLTASVIELNYSDGVTSAIQTQLDSKHGFTHVASGTPYNATRIQVNSVVASATWESVGPTGSGADNIWTALDSLPSGTTWIEVKIASFVVSTGTPAAPMTAETYVRKTGDATAAGTTTLVSSLTIDGAHSATSGELRANENTVVKIPLDSSNRFDVYWNDANTTATTIYMSLAGYSV